MAKRSRTSSTISNLNLPTSDNPSVEAAWRDALAFRELGTNQSAASLKRLAQAHATRDQAEFEAITATKDYCANARSEADVRILKAESTLTKAEKIRADALEWAGAMEEEIQFRLSDAERKRENARTYAAKLEATARGASDALMDQTRTGAEELATRMRTDSAQVIRKILADIEVARASAEDELETQRLLTETARIRAFSSSLSTELPHEEPVELTAAPAKKRASTTKKRTYPSTSVRKAA
ncbi:MAG: hypothetical protein ACKVKV_04585 [Dehalococcoidia bacterium]